MKRLLTFFLLFLAILSCDSSGDGPGVQPPIPEEFDRGTLLANAADNIIIPAYEDLSLQLSDLRSKKDVFVSDPNQNTLNDLRSSWLNAYTVWQSVGIRIDQGSHKRALHDCVTRAVAGRQRRVSRIRGVAVIDQV